MGTMVLGWAGLAAVGHCVTRNRVLREARKGRQGSLAWCYLHPRGLWVYYPKGKTGRILSSICKFLC